VQLQWSIVRNIVQFYVAFQPIPVTSVHTMHNISKLLYFILVFMAVILLPRTHIIYKITIKFKCGTVYA
jgi:hypothetical protein